MSSFLLFCNCFENLHCSFLNLVWIILIERSRFFSSQWSNHTWKQMFFFQYLTKGGPAMLSELYKKILGKKSSVSSEPLQTDSVEDEEDDGNVFTLTQKASDDNNTTYIECTQVQCFSFYKCAWLIVSCFWIINEI